MGLTASFSLQPYRKSGSRNFCRFYKRMSVYWLVRNDFADALREGSLEGVHNSRLTSLFFFIMLVCKLIASK